MPENGQDAFSTASPVTQPWQDGPLRPAIGFARDLPEGDMVATHRHAYGQLLYSSDGVLRVATPGGTWVVPPDRAVWIPPMAEHEVLSLTPAGLRNIYVLPRAARAMPGECRVVEVSRLMRELIMSVIDLPRDYPEDGAAGRLVQVMLDQVADAPAVGLHLPMPEEQRLRAVADSLIADPADPRTLDDWARSAGASARTLARLFEAETGLTFGDWRRQLRLHAALTMLAAGEPVTSVALAVGYESPSAFIAMFRAAMGETPGAFAKRGPGTHARRKM